MATLAFIRAFKSVDFPTFGLPIILTKPLRIKLTSFNYPIKYGTNTNKQITIDTSVKTNVAADPQSFAILARG